MKLKTRLRYYRWDDGLMHSDPMLVGGIVCKATYHPETLEYKIVQVEGNVPVIRDYGQIKSLHLLKKNIKLWFKLHGTVFNEEIRRKKIINR